MTDSQVGDASGGTVLWTVETGDWVNSSPTVVDGTVYVGSQDGRLYAIDAGVDGSSRDTRVCQRTLGHHDRSPDSRERPPPPDGR